MIIGAQKYAVTIPIVNKSNFLFEVRSKNLKTQPCEVSFPGGKIETSENPNDAAIRETVEEIGIKPKIVAELPLLYTPFNMIIHPFIGIINNFSPKLNKNEVEEIFTVPIEFFNQKPKVYKLNVRVFPPKDFPFELIPNGKSYKWRTGSHQVMFYKYKNYIIWGITATLAYHAYKFIKEGGIKI